MALKQNITHRTGFKLSYWRVVAVQMNCAAKTVGIGLCGYKDEAARRDKVDALETLSVQLPFSALPSMPDNLSMAEIYAAIKTSSDSALSNQFKNAQDVIEDAESNDQPSTS